MNEQILIQSHTETTDNLHATNVNAFFILNFKARKETKKKRKKFINY